MICKCGRPARQGSEYCGACLRAAADTQELTALELGPLDVMDLQEGDIEEARRTR